MTHLKKLSLALISAAASFTPVTSFADEEKEGFIEGSTLTVLTRNFLYEP